MTLQNHVFGLLHLNRNSREFGKSDLSFSKIVYFWFVFRKGWIIKCRRAVVHLVYSGRTPRLWRRKQTTTQVSMSVSSPYCLGSSNLGNYAGFVSKYDNFCSKGVWNVELWITSSSKEETKTLFLLSFFARLPLAQRLFCVLSFPEAAIQYITTRGTSETPRSQEQMARFSVAHANLEAPARVKC